MLVRWKSGPASWALIAVAMSVVLTNGCRNGAGTGDGDSSAEAAGEPEQYSATVVRIVEDGTRRETNISRVARAGEQRREEWTRNGQNRALIWRPDIGKAFLLDLDKRAYVEIDITAAPVPESRAGATNPHDVSSAQKPVDLDVKDSTVQAVDQYLGDTQPPTRVETQALSPAVIDGHPCAVYEQRAIFRDGHTETTKRFRARDLSGLLLRVESEAEQGSAKVITERRDVRIEVAPDTFIVPADFKRVEKLPR
jgi:hypothetical protein